MRGPLPAGAQRLFNSHPPRSGCWDPAPGTGPSPHPAGSSNLPGNESAHLPARGAPGGRAGAGGDDGPWARFLVRTLARGHWPTPGLRRAENRWAGRRAGSGPLVWGSQAGPSWASRAGLFGAEPWFIGQQLTLWFIQHQLCAQLMLAAPQPPPYGSGGETQRG